MRVIQFRQKRLLTACALSGLGLIFLYLIFVSSQSGGESGQRVHSRDFDLKKKDPVKAEKHRSHPGEIPKYRDDNKRGNFEPQIPAVNSQPGDGGKAHKLRVEQKQAEERLKGVYGFNQLVSDEISLNRTVPDQREDECRNWDYPTQLPTASVILVFHNEGWSTLFRTVNSIINRSPPQFLHEVVLVDDKSELEHLHEQLDQELKKSYYSKVKLVRNSEREGLIRSRNNGALAATGDVVVFLDAHCEVGYNWLPPLLAPIHEDRTSLTVPVIDGIDWDDFSINPVYAKGSHSRGLFEWGMFYKEGTLPYKEEKKRSHHSEPYNSPTHAGGLFAIDRAWFEELGWYDPGLWVWGGENFELSFKVWMCGGRSLWVPCSRVSHVYRGHSCSSCGSGTLANKFKGVPTTLRNYKRVIEVWFDDEYKEFFYTREPLARFIDPGDLSEQLKLKTDLKCKSFDWFMKEIAYDVFDKYPKLPPNKHWGEMKNAGSKSCVDTMGRHPPSAIGVSGCHGGGGYQLMLFNSKGQLSNGEWCIKAETADTVTIAWCEMGQVSGPWRYDSSSKQMKHSQHDKCLAVHPDSRQLVLLPCDGQNLYHKWDWGEITPHWARRH